MNDLNRLFRERIGYPQDENVTFDLLGTILEKTAWSLPFENLSIMNGNAKQITKESLIQKLLVNNEGGLCYELNPLFYLFLLENVFDVRLVRGEVYKNEANEWTNLGRTHVTILLNHEGKIYLIDTGFGGFLPLKPVPLSGETVSSSNGDFRIRKRETQFGNYIFEMKLKHRHDDWNIGYAFDSKSSVKDFYELDWIKETIKENEASPFNKGPLITRLTPNGNMTLTGTTFTKMEDGNISKKEIENGQFGELAKLYFDLDIRIGQTSGSAL